MPGYSEEQDEHSSVNPSIDSLLKSNKLNITDANFLKLNVNEKGLENIIEKEFKKESNFINKLLHNENFKETALMLGLSGAFLGLTYFGAKQFFYNNLTIRFANEIKKAIPYYTDTKDIVPIAYHLKKAFMQIVNLQKTVITAGVLDTILMSLSLNSRRYSFYNVIKKKDPNLRIKIDLATFASTLFSSLLFFIPILKPYIKAFTWEITPEKYEGIIRNVSMKLPELSFVFNKTIENYKVIYSHHNTFNTPLIVPLVTTMSFITLSFYTFFDSIIPNILSRTFFPILQEVFLLGNSKYFNSNSKILSSFYEEYDMPETSAETLYFNSFIEKLKDTGKVRQKELLEYILGDRAIPLKIERGISSIYLLPFYTPFTKMFLYLGSLFGSIKNIYKEEALKYYKYFHSKSFLEFYLSLPLTKNKSEEELNRLFLKYDDLNKKMINVYLDLLTQIPREEKEVFYPILRVEKLPYYNIKTFFLPIRQELTKEMIKTLIKHGVLVKTHETPNSIIFTLNKEHSLLKDYKRIHNLAVKVVKDKSLEEKLELEAKTIIKLNQVYFKIGEKGLIPTPIGITQLSKKEIEDSVSGVNCEIKNELNKVRGDSLLFFVNEYLEGVPLESYLRMLKETSASVSRKLRDKKSKEELNDLFKRKKEMLMRVFGKVLLTTKRLEKERYDPELQEITTKTRILSYKGFVEDEVLKRLSTYREYFGEDILNFKEALENVVQELIDNTPAKDYKLGLVDATIGNFIMRLKKSRKKKDLIEARLSILDPEIIRQPFIVNIYQLLFDPRNYLTSQERDVLLLEMLETAKKHKVITNYENAKLQFSLYELITRLSTGLMFLEFAMNAEEQGNYNTAKGFITKSKMFLSRVNESREPYFHSQIRDKHQEIADKQMELLISGEGIIKPLLKTLDERLLRLDGYNV